MCVGGGGKGSLFEVFELMKWDEIIFFSLSELQCSLFKHTYCESEEVAEAIANPENLFIEQNTRDDENKCMISANATFRGALDQKACQKIMTKFHVTLYSDIFVSYFRGGEIVC